MGPPTAEARQYLHFTVPGVEYFGARAADFASDPTFDGGFGLPMFDGGRGLPMFDGGFGLGLPIVPGGFEVAFNGLTVAAVFTGNRAAADMNDDEAGVGPPLTGGGFGATAIGFGAGVGPPEGVSVTGGRVVGGFGAPPPGIVRSIGFASVGGFQPFGALPTIGFPLPCAPPTAPGPVGRFVGSSTVLPSLLEDPPPLDVVPLLLVLELLLVFAAAFAVFAA